MFVAGIAALGTSAAALGSALPAGAAATPTSTAQNSIIVGSGSSTTYNMMQAIDTIFNDAEINACPMFESAVGQGSQTQQLNFACATFGGSSPGTFGPIGGASAVNPFNDAAVEEAPLGSSNGIAQLEDAGGAYGTTGVDDYTGINFARSSRDPAGSDDSGLNFVAYAKDGVPWLHYTEVDGLPTPSAKVVSLTQTQLEGIYEGGSGSGAPIYEWNQVQTGVLTCKASTTVAVTSVSLILGSNTLTVATSFPGTVVDGQFVVGTNIPAGGKVTNVSGNTLTMTNNATKTTTETVDFEVYNSAICTAASQIVPNYAQPSSNLAPIIVVSAQEGSGTQSTFKTFLGNKDPSANNEVNCDDSGGLAQAPTWNTSHCVGPLVIFENELTQATNLFQGQTNGAWSCAQQEFVFPAFDGTNGDSSGSSACTSGTDPAGAGGSSTVPWSIAQSGTGEMSQINLYQDMIFFYSYGKWTEQCAKKDCGAFEHALPSNYVAALGEVGGTANPGSGTHTGANASTWAAGTKATEATILGNVSGSCGSACTGDGLFPIDRYLYNVYSNGTNTTSPGGIPEATAATLNYVSEVGFMCKASDEYNIDPNTNKTYLSEIQAAIEANGFYPLSAGAAANGTVNTTPIDEGDAISATNDDADGLLGAYASAHPGVQDVDFITPGTDEAYSSTAWGSGQTNGTEIGSDLSPVGYCLFKTTGT